MPSQLPQRPNLEFLKKLAKERLDRLRQQDPSAALADAQHALAREYGFDSWTKLKAHIDAAAHPFEGTWNADVTKSRRHPANLFQRATLRVVVKGDGVTITHDAISESGRKEQGTHALQADGVERSFEHGYTLVAKWLGPRVLQVIATQEGRPAGGGTYEVAPDGKTLIVATGEQRLVFVRA